MVTSGIKPSRPLVRNPSACSRLPRLLLENTLHNARADAELSADLENAVAIGPQLQYTRLHRWLNSASAELGALRFRASEPSVDTLSDDSPFKLGEDTEHLKNRLA